jgi:hypothetical protein
VRIHQTDGDLPFAAFAAFVAHLEAVFGGSLTVDDE